MQQRGEAAQAVAEVDGLERQRVRAADGEELPRQQRAALGGAGDRVQLLADQRILRAGRGQAGAGQDDRQQVGEVVRDAAGEQAQALELLGAVEARLELVLLVLGGAAQLDEADARGGHRDLAAHRDQVLGLLDARHADAFVPEGAAAERAERLVEQAQRQADDGAVAELGDDARVGARVRARVLDDDRTFGGEDLLHHRVAGDRDPRRGLPDEVLARAAVPEHADERRLLVVGDAQPGVIEADRVPHLGAGHVEDLHEARGALQLPRECEQPRADGEQGAVHVNPCVQLAQPAF